MPKPKANPHVLFDTTNFAALMHSADDTPDAAREECPECGEHMLDCECDEVEEVVL